VHETISAVGSFGGWDFTSPAAPAILGAALSVTWTVLEKAVF
jgi:hypothetical protein